MGTRLPKLNYWLNKAFHDPEIATTIFVVTLFLVSTLANFVLGFSLPLFVLASASAIFLVTIYPRSGVYSIVILTFLFERFFTLQAIVVGRIVYKFYPLDAILGAVLLGIFFQLITGKLKLKLGRPEKLLVLFMVLCAFVLALSISVLGGEFALAFSSFKNYSVYSVFFFVVILLFNQERYQKRLLYSAVAGAMGIIFFIIYGIVSGAGLWSEYTPLSTEGVRTLAFPHGFYLSMVVVGLMAYWSFRDSDIFSSQASRSIFWVSLFWLMGIVGSMMRHLWGGLALALVIIFWLAKPQAKRRFVGTVWTYSIVLAIALGIFAFVSVLFPFSKINHVAVTVERVVVQRVASLGSASKDESFSWRNSVWDVAIREYLKKPITGLGFGKNLAVETDGYKDFVEVRGIHNSFLAMFVQVGPIVFAVFLLFIWSVVSPLFVSQNRNWLDVALIALILFYILVAMFQPYLETNLLGIFFWMMLGLGRITQRSFKGNNI